MSTVLTDYFRCPEHLAVLEAGGPSTSEPGYFRFRDAICWGRQGVGAPSARLNGHMVDVAAFVSTGERAVVLPFDLAEVVGNLYYERYPTGANTSIERLSGTSFARTMYYSVRPLLPVAIRKHIQRLSLSGWRRIAFPRWPVDVTVESLMRHALRLVLEQGGAREIPFIWFWPEGAPGCLMMTHDVEGPAGAEFAPRLMDLDDEFGVRSSFQLVPEAAHTWDLLGLCRRRGFEVNVHDLNHDGQLYRDKALFDARVAEINRYAREFESRGFRSGAMYRRQDWFDALEVSFDMSVPNLAHFEPQQGGCCTVMPHFIGKVLELPLTTSQDYALFHYLGDYSLDVWKAQLDVILANNGLASFIAHPDYLAQPRAFEVYRQLLTHLEQLRTERDLWLAAPSEIDRWWRERSRMQLVADGTSWRLEGPGSERARVAYARLEGERLVYQVGRSRLAA